MAEVFAAKLQGPAGFEKDVAVKRILPRLAHDPIFLERFLNEARLAARLSHPNIVQIFELGHDGTDHYIVMEAVRGKSLRALQERLDEVHEVMPANVAVHIAQGLCAGLAHADEQLKLIHRDVSPHNVLLSFDGAVKLIDFGIARVRSGDQLTQVGQVLGKVRYLSPEQAQNKPLDARADIFAVGVVLYEMLTGRHPFNGKDPEQIMRRLTSGRRKPLRELAPDVSPELEAVVDKALAVDVEKRFESAREMGAALARASASIPGGSHDVEALLRRTFPDDVSRAWPVFDESRADGAEHTATQNVRPREIAISSEPSGEAEPTTVVVDDGPTLDHAASPPRSSRTWLLPAAGAALLIVVGAAVVVSSGPDPGEKPAVRPPAAPPPPPAVVDTKPIEAPIESRPIEPIAPIEPVEPVEPAEPTDASVVDNPAPVEGPRTRRPVKARPGKLAVVTRPWTKVKIDGRDAGVTPLLVDTTAGPHKLLLENAESGVRREVEVKVASDETTTLRLDLSK
jgi:serine/threonine-protein kinase